jgi:hypothetical protein
LGVPQSISPIDNLQGLPDKIQLCRHCNKVNPSPGAMQICWVLYIGSVVWRLLYWQHLQGSLIVFMNFVQDVLSSTPILSFLMANWSRNPIDIEVCGRCLQGLHAVWCRWPYNRKSRCGNNTLCSVRHQASTWHNGQGEAIPQH